MSDSLRPPWTIGPQPPLFMGFLRQKYWSGLPFPSPGDPPDPEIELVSPVPQADSLPLTHLGSLCVSFISNPKEDHERTHFPGKQCRQCSQVQRTCQMRRQESLCPYLFGLRLSILPDIPHGDKAQD